MLTQNDLCPFWPIKRMVLRLYIKSLHYEILTVFRRPKVSRLCCSPTNWPFGFMFHNCSRYRVRIYTKVSKIATLLWVPMSTWQLKLTLSKGWTTILPCWLTLVFLWRFFYFILFLENDHKAKNKTKLDIDWGKKPRPLFTTLTSFDVDFLKRLYQELSFCFMVFSFHYLNILTSFIFLKVCSNFHDIIRSQ